MGRVTCREWKDHFSNMQRLTPVYIKPAQGLIALWWRRYLFRCWLVPVDVKRGGRRCSSQLYPQPCSSYCLRGVEECSPGDSAKSCRCRQRAASRSRADR